MAGPYVEQPTAQAPPEKAGGGTLGPTCVAYLKTIPGILKFVEFFTLLIAFACGADVYNQLPRRWGRMDFFLVVTITGWIIVLIHVVSSVIFKRNLNGDWYTVFMVFAFVEATLLLISSTLLGGTANRFLLTKLQVAVGFGLISALVFSGDGFVHYLIIRGVM